MALSRRDVIKALTSLPAVASIEVAQVQPHDVIVVEIDEHISQEAGQWMTSRLQEVWPGRKIVIVGPGARLKVVRQT